MAILFTQYWDVMPGLFDDYAAFISNEYNAAMNSMGIRLVGGYYVVVGEGPRIVAVAEVENVDSLQRILATKEYRLVSDRLNKYVWKYSSKVWAPASRVLGGPYVIQTGVWKFNQYYNVLPGRDDEHYRFVKDECLPALKALGIPMTGGWRLAIGTGPKILAECTARGAVEIAKAVDSAEFRRLVRKLKNESATDYSSRILAPTGRIEVPYLMSEMMKKF
ncbi:MAG: hypothetical protein R6X07_02000 [Desulfatiglandales bacterium]